MKFLDEAYAVGQCISTLLQQRRRRKAAVPLPHVLKPTAQMKPQPNASGHFKLKIGGDTSWPEVMMVRSGGATRERKLNEADFSRQSDIIRGQANPARIEAS